MAPWLRTPGILALGPPWVGDSESVLGAGTLLSPMRTPRTPSWCQMAPLSALSGAGVSLSPIFLPRIQSCLRIGPRSDSVPGSVSIGEVLTLRRGSPLRSMGIDRERPEGGSGRRHEGIADSTTDMSEDINRWN